MNDKTPTKQTMQENLDNKTSCPQSEIKAWLQKKQGQTALNRLQLLLQDMSEEAKPNEKMLLCGENLDFFAPNFADVGFEVTCGGTPAQISAIRKKNDKRLNLHISALEHLPFSRREFSRTILLLAFSPPLDFSKVLSEALRTTRQEIIITALNRSSFFYTGRDIFNDEANRLLWTTIQEIRKELYALKIFYFRQRSILPGPPASWTVWPNWLDKLPLPLGAFFAIKIDLQKERIKTPLFDKLKEHGLLQTNISEVYNRNNG